MSFSFRRSFILILALAISPAFSMGGAFGLNSGESIQGEISEIMGKNITIAHAGGELRICEIADFDAAAQLKIRGWRERHLEAGDVFSRWDTQPLIKSSSQPVLPAKLLADSFRGTASVDLILDEKGRVIDAKVWKSTHPEWEKPTVKVMLRIPLKGKHGV